MEKLSYETVQNFCRACLKNLKQRRKFQISSLNWKIRHWLEDISLDNPMSHDIYSNSVCQSCRNKLKEFLEFHLMCKQSRTNVNRLIAAYNENKIKECAKNTSKVADPDIAKNLSGFKYLIKTEDESITVEDNEPIICGSILNVVASKNTSKNVKNAFGHFADDGSDPKELDKISCSDISAENESIHSYSEGDIQIKDDKTNFKQILKNKATTTKNIKLSNCKAEKKKYTYSFPCDQCKYRSVSQQFLDIHKRTHYGLKLYQCPNCDDSFNKTTALLKHLNDIHSQKELIFICEHENCGIQFASSRNYKDHYRKNHIQQLNKKQDKHTTKSISRHVCEECGKVYTKLQTFKEHQYTHGSKEFYPFQCDICDKAFVKQRTYNEHKLRHAGIKNFECPHCGVKRTTKKELREHVNSHTRERQYPCPNCPMIFYRTSNRRVHIDVVHQGIRRFACRYCDQAFGKGDNLKNHELLHTGEKPHACSECGKRFVQRVSLRLHMKTHK